MDVPTQPVKGNRPSLHQGMLTLVSNRARFVPGANRNFQWVSSDPLLGWLAPALYLLNDGQYIKLSPDLEECFKAQYQQNQHRWMFWQDRLALTLADLRQAGIPVLPLKGAAFIEQIYNDEGLRPFNNVNLLVPDQHFREAVEILLGNGFHLDESQGTELFEAMSRSDHSARPFQVELFEPGSGLIVELQRHLLKSKLLLDGFEINIRQIWNRRVNNLKRGSLWTYYLSPYDTLAYLCLFQAMRGLSNMVTYMDIDGLIRMRSGSWDWGEFVRTVQQWQIRTAAYHALLFSQALLKTPLPPDMLKHLDPGPLARQRVALLITPRMVLAQSPSLAQRYPNLIKLACFDRPGTIIRQALAVLRSKQDLITALTPQEPAAVR